MGGVAEPQVGWYVGYLETHDDVGFRLNMDIRSETDLPLRKQLVREALVAKGIIRQDGTIKPKNRGLPDDAQDGCSFDRTGLSGCLEKEGRSGMMLSSTRTAPAYRLS